MLSLFGRAKRLKPRSGRGYTHLKTRIPCPFFYAVLMCLVLFSAVLVYWWFTNEHNEYHTENSNNNKSIHTYRVPAHSPMIILLIMEHGNWGNITTYSSL